MKKVGIISLGCSRNLVDSEIILGSLKESGFTVSEVEKGVDLLIVNTCAFIESAREESIDTILQAAQLKKEGKAKHLVVCGCLPQLYKERFLKELPEADVVLGTNDFFKIKDIIKDLGGKTVKSVVSKKLHYLYDESSPRFFLTPRHYAYVKISEGCSNFCSYCIISRLRGKFRSRTIESIINEVRHLSASGALKEINLIGQDTTMFGTDRREKRGLSQLLKRISRLENSIRWIRILYTHPAHYTDELVATIRDEKKICKYIDLPVQHISNNVLERMNRQVTKKDIRKLIEKLRKAIRGFALRTSVIVGFPGESDSDFKELLGFLKDMRFERLGAFIYSREEGTKAAQFKNQIPEHVKKDRFDEVMKLQQDISREVNQSFLGKTLDVLVDEKVAGERDKFLGRTEADAPEVDGTVYVTGKGVRVGEFCRVKISDTLEYDLVGEAI